MAGPACTILAEFRTKSPLRRITKLGERNVLCALGSVPNDHASNVAFHDLMNAGKHEYLAVSPRDHGDKNHITRDVSASVRARGLWFLKKVVRPGRGAVELYVYADKTVVREKAKQALRQHRHKPVTSAHRRKMAAWSRGEQFPCQGARH